MSEEITCAVAPRQLKLFHLENQLTLRFGNGFFRSLPEKPGVYFFHGGDGQLLYIGQSSNLRARLGSYRHVGDGKHPRRTLRLVARVARIEWQECSSAEEAIELERTLILEHRPPFNRAGVWKGDPWWLVMEVQTKHLILRLQREASPDGFGPLRPAARYSLATVVRSLLRLANPGWRLSDFPLGLMASVLPRECYLPVLSPSDFALALRSVLAGEFEELLASLDALPLADTETEKTFWQEGRESLGEFRPLALSEDAS